MFHERFDESLTDIRAKHPIIVDLFASLYLFCTHSDRVMENSWFNLKYIRDTMNIEND